MPKLQNFYGINFLCSSINHEIHEFYIPQKNNNKSLNLRKEIGITIKSKEMGSQLRPVRNSHVTTYNAPAATCNCYSAVAQTHVAKCMYK